MVLVAHSVDMSTRLVRRLVLGEVKWLYTIQKFIDHCNNVFYYFEYVVSIKYQHKKT